MALWARVETLRSIQADASRRGRIHTGSSIERRFGPAGACRTDRIRYTDRHVDAGDAPATPTSLSARIRSAEAADPADYARNREWNGFQNEKRADERSARSIPDPEWATGQHSSSRNTRKVSDRGSSRCRMLRRHLGTTASDRRRTPVRRSRKRRLHDPNSRHHEPSPQTSRRWRKAKKQGIDALETASSRLPMI